MTTKGTRTRDGILAAASRQFGERGYQGATVRSIAKEAGIDPSMVIRYFGSKEDLFLAASRLDLDVVRFSGAERPHLGRRLAEHVVLTWEDSEVSRPLRVLLSASTTDPRAAERVRSVFSDQVLPVVRSVRDDAEVCAAFIASQILGFALSRYILALEPLSGLDRESAVDWLGSALQHHLDHPG